MNTTEEPTRHAKGVSPLSCIYIATFLLLSLGVAAPLLRLNFKVCGLHFRSGTGARATRQGFSRIRWSDPSLTVYTFTVDEYTWSMGWRGDWWSW
ncbi:MAG: hypothetical protein JWN70_2222 [Planctomycetaceae bacterium]|nr:hypothetical protein [Planctomycetaceae bacterium]